MHTRANTHTHKHMQVQQWVASCEAALSEQNVMVEARELEVEAAAARLRAAEAELDFLADARQVGGVAAQEGGGEREGEGEGEGEREREREHLFTVPFPNVQSIKLTA